MNNKTIFFTHQNITQQNKITTELVNKCDMG